MEPDPARRGVVIPHAELSPEALRSLVEEFVTRAGTDYGAIERSVAEKVAEVTAQITSGEASIVFDPETETVGVVPTRELSEA